MQEPKNIKEIIADLTYSDIIIDSPFDYINHLEVEKKEKDNGSTAGMEG